MRYFFFFLSLICSSGLLAQPQTVGLFENAAGSFNGYTLFASNGYTSTYLIDNCGRLVNEWPGEHLPGNAYYFSEDGFLYRSVAIPSNRFSGGGIGGRIEKLNWEGELVWEYEYASNSFHQHHDFALLPNGNIIFLAWEYKTVEMAIAAGRNPDLIGGELWPDHIIEVKPIGNFGGSVQWEWHAWDHLIQNFDSTKENFGAIADHPELIDVNYISSPDNATERDWIHSNSIYYNEERDEIIISSREFSEFWIIDHSTTSEEAAGHTGGNAGRGGDLLYRWGNPQTYQRGSSEDQKLFSQHDVHWIPEGFPNAGKIMLFNNGKDRPGGNASSVDIITLPLDGDGNYMLEEELAYGPSELDWTYFPGPSADFYSAFISGAQRLPNGNTLICEGLKSKIFEIDENEEIVWEYINPVGFLGPFPQGEEAQGTTVFRAYRYAENYVGFDGKDLSSGVEIELDPLPNDCEIMTNTENLDNLKSVIIFPNPVDQQLNIQATKGSIGRLKVIDILGKVHFDKEVASAEFDFPTIHLQEGIYFLVIDEKEVRKFICKH